MTKEDAKEAIKEAYGNSEYTDEIIKALEQEPTTKNDLGVDCISRTDVLKLIYDYKENHSENREEYPINYGTLLDIIRWVIALPSVTPQESQTFKWCTDCKEYDQEKHCCHRWSKVIRDTVEEMRQEPILDKIREEIVELTKCPYGTECLGANCPSNTDCMICGDHVLQIIEKYKTKTEQEDGNDD